MVMLDERVELSPRESLLMQNDTEERRLAREHAVRMKQLELELARERYKAQIELRKLEARWASWLRLPGLILRLPVHILLSVGYIIDSIKNQEPSQHFWKLMR
jgi:hypothetical protein